MRSEDYETEYKLRRRINDLEHALVDAADEIERVYGELPTYQPPGPPTSFVAKMRAIADAKVR